MREKNLANDGISKSQTMRFQNRLLRGGEGQAREGDVADQVVRGVSRYIEKHKEIRCHKLRIHTINENNATSKYL